MITSIGGFILSPETVQAQRRADQAALDAQAEFEMQHEAWMARCQTVAYEVQAANAEAHAEMERAARAAERAAKVRAAARAEDLENARVQIATRGGSWHTVGDVLAAAAGMPG